jgi:hypothetical protein
MLRSFDLEDNHENLEEQEDNPFDYLSSIYCINHWLLEAPIMQTLHKTQ